MKIGEKIELKKIICRDVDINELLSLLKADLRIYWSWGVHALCNLNNKGLRFAVNGHHHKGHVYIVLNGSDLFDVYYTTLKGKIVDIETDLFFDMLVDSIDKRIEYINNYK